MTSDSDRTKLDLQSLARLIEGEQKLLALFDARQTSTDAKLAAALTAALALPAVTLGVAEQLSSQETLFKVGYGIVMALVIIVCVLRMWAGWWLRLRSQKSVEGKSKARTISTESAAITAATVTQAEFPMADP